MRNNQTSVVLVILATILLTLTACPRVKKDEAPKWRAVIAFIDDPNEASEDWSYYSDAIAQGCKGDNIHFAWGDAKNPKVKIGPKDAPVATVDITGSLKEHHLAWLLVEPGPKTTVLQYDPANVEKAIGFCEGE